MAQLTPLPLTVSYFSKIHIGFTFLAPAHPGSPWKRAVKRVCVCVWHLLKLTRKGAALGAKSDVYDTGAYKASSSLLKSQQVTICFLCSWIMFHTTLDAVGNILRVHYKRWNVMFHLHKVARVRYLGVCKTFITAYSSAKIIKVERVFPELRS